jgi:hypothetical protein
VAGQCRRAGAAGHIPQPHGAVVAAADECVAVW